MKTELIKRIIQDQEIERRRILEEERIVERDVDKNFFCEMLKHPNILAILGLRRCGKSVLSWLILKDERFGYVNFDDERLYGLRADDLNAILKAFYELYGDIEYIILDEPQNVRGWELFANRLRRTKKVIITGSNSKLLSGELATHLTGRHVDFILYPFSFREFLRYNGVNLKDIEKYAYATSTEARISKLLLQYIEKGGLPESHKFGKNILRSIFSDIIKKDILMRHEIKKVKMMEDMVKYMISNFSKPFTYNKLRNVFGMKIDTVENYMGYMEDAYLIEIIKKFSFKLKEQRISPKKVYCIDTGFINIVAFRFLEDYGRLMENLVAIELKRRGKEVYYWKDYQQREVDFVIKEGLNVKELIQVCYDIEDLSTKNRELRALIKASKELKCKNLKVITWDYEGREEFKGKEIEFIPLWKWLLRI